MTKINIIYQDKHLIIVNKPYNLLSMASLKEKEKTLYHEVLMYEKTKHKSNKIFIVHRLDKETGGLMLFAKDEKTKKIMQDNWDKVNRKYFALVNGSVLKDEEMLKTYLLEDKFMRVYFSKKGALALTHYKVIQKNQKYTLLDVQIFTCKKHQIRVSLNNIGHSIVNDKKYGFGNSKMKHLGLLAYHLSFIHPYTRENLSFSLPIPKEFLDFVKK
jgi:RluA family pseudouridine synthase